MFGIFAPNFHVAEFSVGQQLTIAKDRAADPSAKGEHNHHPFAIHPRAKTHLRNPSGIGIIEDVNRGAGGSAENRFPIGIDPARIDIRRGQDHPMLHYRGEGATNRPLVVELRCQLGDYAGHRLRGRRDGRFNALALGYKLTLLYIHDGTFNATTANIYTENLHSAFSSICCRLFLYFLLPYEISNLGLWLSVYIPPDG